MEERDLTPQLQPAPAAADASVKEWHEPVLTIMPANSAETGTHTAGDVSFSS